MNENNDQHSTGSPAPMVWPSIGFTDIDAGVDFLTRTLGFTVTARYQDEDGTVQHAEARWPDGGGVMFGSRGKTGAWGALGPQGAHVVAAESSTVDGSWSRVQESGWAEVLEPLTDTDYGSHQFTVRDGDGSLWTLGPTAAHGPVQPGTGTGTREDVDPRSPTGGRADQLIPRCWSAGVQSAFHPRFASRRAGTS